MMGTEVTTPSEVRSVLSDDIATAIVTAAEDCDMVILGLSRVGANNRVISAVVRKVIANTDCAALVISEKG